MADSQSSFRSQIPCPHTLAFLLFANSRDCLPRAGLTYFVLRSKNRPMKSTDKTETVYFSTKGQVVIPRRLRQELEIEEGTKAIVYRQADHLILKPITRSHINRLRGSLKGTGAMKEFLSERKRERKL